MEHKRDFDLFQKIKPGNGSHRGFRFFVRDPLLSPCVGGRRIKKWGEICFFVQFTLSFRLARRYFRSKILKLIWYFAHLFVSLQREMKKKLS